jgi:FkbM family methyltransferase
MFRTLFTIYRRSPFKVKKLLNSASGIARLAARLVVHRVRIGGYWMYLDFHDNASFRYYTDRGSYETVLVESILTLISKNPGSYFLDLGASYGAYALAVGNLGRYGLVKRIYSFEADPRCCAALGRSVQDNGLAGLVEVNNVIIGDYAGTADFLRSPSASTSNRTFASRDDTMGFKKVERLACTTIDAFLAERMNVDESTFVIKMDIEGNELRAFKGMNRLLTHSRGFAILFEYYPLGIAEVGLEPGDVRGFVKALPLEFAYAETKAGLQRLSGPDELIAAMQKVEKKENAKFAGSSGNFIIGRGMSHFAGPAQ